MGVVEESKLWRIRLFCRQHQ